MSVLVLDIGGRFPALPGRIILRKVYGAAERAYVPAEVTDEMVERAARAVWDLTGCCPECWPDQREILMTQQRTALLAALGTTTTPDSGRESQP